MNYIVTAGYVTVETSVPGGRARIDIPRGAPLPGDVPAQDIERLLGLGHIAAAASESEPDPDAVPDGTVGDVLAWVGEDLARAERALDAEQDKGERARKGIVDPLTELLTRP